MAGNKHAFTKADVADMDLLYGLAGCELTGDQYWIEQNVVWNIQEINSKIVRSLWHYTSLM